MAAILAMLAQKNVNRSCAKQALVKESWLYGNIVYMYIYLCAKHDFQEVSVSCSQGCSGEPFW